MSNPAAQRLRWAADALRMHCPHVSGDVFHQGHDATNAIPLHRLFIIPPGSPAAGGSVEDVAARRTLPLCPATLLLLPADRRYRFRFAPGLQLVGFHFRIEVVPGHDILGTAVRWGAHPCAAEDAATAWRSAASATFADSLELDGILRRTLARHVELAWSEVDRAVLALRRWQETLADLERLGVRRAVAACARRRGMSREGFSRAFRRDLGVSPTQWQTRRLAERACAALLASDASLEEIAASLGLSEGAAVSRLVMRVTGRRPSAIRAQRSAAG